MRCGFRKTASDGTGEAAPRRFFFPRHADGNKQQVARAAMGDCIATCTRRRKATKKEERGKKEREGKKSRLTRGRLRAQCNFTKYDIEDGIEKKKKKKKKKRHRCTIGEEISRPGERPTTSFLFFVWSRLASFNLNLELKLSISNHHTISSFSRITRKRRKIAGRI